MKAFWQFVAPAIMPALITAGVTILVWVLNDQENSRATKTANIQAATTARDARVHAMDAVLDTYLNQIANLMLNRHLGQPIPVATTSEKASTDTTIANAKAGGTTSNAQEQAKAVVAIARARTLVALGRLDPKWQASLMRLMVESKLVPVIDLSVINLEGASMEGFNLSCDKPQRGLCANLRWSWLGRNKELDKNTDLSYSNLAFADLEYAHLHRAILIRTDLTWTHLDSFRLHRYMHWVVRPRNLAVRPNS